MKNSSVVEFVKPSLTMEEVIDRRITQHVAEVRLLSSTSHCEYFCILKQREHNSWFCYIFNLATSDSLRSRKYDAFFVDFVIPLHHSVVCRAFQFSTCVNILL